MTTPTDSELVMRTRAGEDGAADALFERHWPAAWWTAFSILSDRALADDAAQEAVARAFAALDRFDTSRPFRPWLVRIAANQALNVRRSRRHEVTFPEPALNGHGPDHADHLAARDALVGALRRLPEERRTVVALRYFGDLTPDEIAAALELPVGTVSSRLSRALAQLRELLEVPR